MTGPGRSGYRLSARSAEQDAVLDRVVARCAEVGSRGMAVFDLDGCLFDNRPRQVQILRVWAALHDVTELAALEVDHLQDWSMRSTFERLGLPPQQAADLAQRARPFWERWFFDDAFVAHDRALPGAPRFVRTVAATGVRVVYLTGRHRDQRPSTLLNLERHGFPIDPAGANLVTKDDAGEGDAAYKRRAFAALADERAIAAFLDNEPVHVAHARARFPGAVVVWVRTDHSPGAERPDGPAIDGFLRTSDR